MNNTPEAEEKAGICPIRNRPIVQYRLQSVYPLAGYPQPSLPPFHPMATLLQTMLYPVNHRLGYKVHEVVQDLSAFGAKNAMLESTMQT